MKGLLAAFAVTMAITTAPATAAPDAPHMHDHCVSYPEFVKAPYGPKRSVERFVGAKGKRGTDHMVDISPHLVAYEYRTCQAEDWLVILYRRSTMQAIQFWYAEGYPAITHEPTTRTIGG